MESYKCGGLGEEVICKTNSKKEQVFTLENSDDDNAVDLVTFKIMMHINLT